jgi:hypothetical protein
LDKRPSSDFGSSVKVLVYRVIGFKTPWFSTALYLFTTNRSSSKRTIILGC